MANVLNANPFVIDTAGSSLLYSRAFKCKGIRWIIESGALATDVAEIQDDQGKTLWRSICTPGAGAQYVEDVLQERWWYAGFKVTTLSRGKLYIDYL